MMICKKLSAMRWRGSGQIHNANLKQAIVPVYTSLAMFTRNGHGVKAAIDKMHLAGDAG
jgi:hypothetical protein